MSLSLSIHLSVVNLFSLQHSKHLKQDVLFSRVFQGSFREISRVFQEILKGISSSFRDSRVFEGSSTGKFLGCFKEVSRNF